MQDNWKTEDTPRVLMACAHALAGKRRILAGSLFLLFCPAAPYAAEWSLDPAVTVAVGNESNAALTIGPHDSVSRTVLFPRITIERTTETSEVNLELQARATYYSSSEFENTQEKQVALSSFIQSTERTKLAFDAEYRWDTLFESETIVSGTGNPQDVDIGLVTTSIDRDWREVQPMVVYALTERSSLAFLYRLTDVLFDNVGTTGLVDYQQHYLSGSYFYRLTDTNDLRVVVQGAQFRPGAGTESDSTALLAGINHKFSSITNAGFQAGVGETAETYADGSQAEVNTIVLEATATQQSELSRLEALISRGIQPSGSGRSVSADQLRVFWDRRLYPAIRLRVWAKIFRNQALEGTDLAVDRHYAETEVRLSWRIMPEWSLSTAYKYRTQKYDADVDSAESSGVVFAATWVPQQWR